MSRSFPILTAAQIASAAERIMQRCDELARCSEEPSRLTRTFCCPEMTDVHSRLTEWMNACGMRCHVDAVANLIGRRESAQPTASVFMIGSHLDTVVDAGKYDGTLGVLLGLGVVELLHAARIELPFTLDVIGFCDEEGVRFNTPFLGSRAVAGEFATELLDLVDNQGTTVRQALDAFGVESANWPSAEYPADQLRGFLEPHIEQGPLLEQSTTPVGVVAAIAGQTRSTFVFSGQAGHAGTVPHDCRKDALAAAAEFICGVERLGQRTDGLLATVGDVRAWPNVSNVIAGEAQVRLDLRHAEDLRRAWAYEQIRQLAAEISARRGVEWGIDVCEHQPSVAMDERLSRALSTAIANTGHAVHGLVSGAGHDAVMMAGKTPTSMLFLRCRGGVSHHPDEFVAADDVAAALEVMVNMVASMDA